MEKDGGKKRNQTWGAKAAAGKIISYCKSHMWCSFALAILTSIILLIFIMMVYMREQYYTYLVETTYTTEKALLDSVNKNMESQLENFVDIGSGISVDEELIETITVFVKDNQDVNGNKDIKKALQSAAQTSSSIVGIAIAAQDKVLFQYDKIEKTDADKEPIWGEEAIQKIYDDLKSKNDKNFIPRYKIVTRPMFHPNENEKGIIHIAFPIKNQFTYRNMKYMMIITYYSASLNTLLKQLNENQENYIQGYIEDENGEILLHTGGKKYLGKGVGYYRGDKNVTDLTVNIGDYGWKLHAVIDEKMIQMKVDKVYLKMVFLYIAVILVIMTILFWVTNRILRPINMISRSISQVKNGDTREQLPIEGTNEVWQLAREYNEMIQAITEANQEVEEQHGRVIESMKMKQRAEREALESQINAHFICNTLNAINYEAIDSGNYKVSILLKKLSNILRYTFDQKHQNVYMFQEISWIEQYLYLQKERLDKVFDYEICFDSDYDNWSCRKLMLQPFVENSILHGFEGRASGGFIRITGEGYREFLKIVIEDNGLGMDFKQKKMIQEILENPMAAKKNEVGIGISNVITRMKMYYGKDFQVSLETEEGKGTRFTFILPAPEVAEKK